MKLYVARHGQTQWNLENRVCGNNDIDLTNEGIEQAKQLALSLSDKHIRSLFTSPLKRAKQTAAIISEVIGANVIIDDRLIEQNYGIFEGTNRNDEEFKQRKGHFTDRMGDGESILQVAQRVYNFLDEINTKYLTDNLMIITHGSVCRVIHSYFNDLRNDDYVNFYIKNCEVKVYERKRV